MLTVLVAIAKRWKDYHKLHWSEPGANRVQRDNLNASRVDCRKGRRQGTCDMIGWRSARQPNSSNWFCHLQIIPQPEMQPIQSELITSKSWFEKVEWSKASLWAWKKYRKGIEWKYSAHFGFLPRCMRKFGQIDTRRKEHLWIRFCRKIPLWDGWSNPTSIWAHLCTKCRLKTTGFDYPEGHKVTDYKWQN